MKKILFLIVFIIGISFEGHSQIQRTFLGCTFGVTSKATTLQKIKNLGYEVEKFDNFFDPNGIMYRVKGGVAFGGYTWDDVRIRFINGKFAAFYLEGRFGDSIYNKLSTNLLNKYSKYKTSYSSPSTYFYDFNDGKTEVSIDGSYNRVVLMYDDVKLTSTKSNNSTTDDL